MPWKASSVMGKRLRCVARLLDSDAMTEVCRDSRDIAQTHGDLPLKVALFIRPANP